MPFILGLEAVMCSELAVWNLFPLGADGFALALAWARDVSAFEHLARGGADGALGSALRLDWSAGTDADADGTV